MARVRLRTGADGGASREVLARRRGSDNNVVMRDNDGARSTNMAINAGSGCWLGISVGIMSQRRRSCAMRAA